MNRGVELRGAIRDGYDRILTPEALAFVAELQRTFGVERSALLERRATRMEAIAAGELPGFLPETADVRNGAWEVPPPPRDLVDRRVEITGPTDRKMMINALNSGARVFMADLEDANSPTWDNMVSGQANLRDAFDGTISFTSAEGRVYRLAEETATLVVRPRGWHLPEAHLVVDGRPCSGSLFDFGLAFFHNARGLIERGSGPYFYLAKLEGHREARLWNDVFVFAEDRLGLDRGTIRATALIETILAAFEMDEILFELREHSAGLNAGRWDYIFSIIKKFRDHPAFVLPDRSQVSMTVPFMRAYTELLVKTCHRRKASAIGGMAAFIPNRRDPAANEVALAKVREDKVREATDGFDGTWVAHPDLEPVAREVFDGVLGDRSNQFERTRDEVDVTAADLLRVEVPGGAVTEPGLRGNVSIAILYLESWLRGAGAAALFDLMEDTATAEISRSQVWQWLRHGTALAEGGAVTVELVERVIAEELAAIERAVGAERFESGRFTDAVDLFRSLVLSETFEDFLTLPAYDRLLRNSAEEHVSGQG